MLHAQIWVLYQYKSKLENTLFAAVKIVIKSNSQACLPIAALFIYFIHKALQLKG